MMTRRGIVFRCSILCVVAALTYSMKPHHGPRPPSHGKPHAKITGHDHPLCRRVSLCPQGWVQLCRTPNNEWTIFCVQLNSTCEQYWRKICTNSSIPYCSSTPKHCICACADSRVIMKAKNKAE
ncbi:uncharacterized protein LOC142765639 [Rhipicephalus microplus]|uniref:uncharacterized protein LOC142765639 n=1 Tax=Rhipicephalus microplus TaxID=6941 RepID=UPI003F6AA5D4